MSTLDCICVFPVPHSSFSMRKCRRNRRKRRDRKKHTHTFSESLSPSPLPFFVVVNDMCCTVQHHRRPKVMSCRRDFSRSFQVECLSTFNTLFSIPLLFLAPFSFLYFQRTIAAAAAVAVAVALHYIRRRLLNLLHRWLAFKRFQWFPPFTHSHAQAHRIARRGVWMTLATCTRHDQQQQQLGLIPSPPPPTPPSSFSSFTVSPSK